MSLWRTVALGDIAESIDYGVTASAKEQPPGPKFLRITDIQNGAVQWADVPWCDCDPQSAAAARLKAGDIVFARTGATTGKSFLIRECPADAVFASYLIRVRLPAAVEPRYVSRYFQTPEYWAQIARSARGVAQPGVNATTLKSLTIPLPPLPEQRRVAAILDKADDLRAKRRAALDQLNGLTQSMFLEMFRSLLANVAGHSVPLRDCADVVSGVTKGRAFNGRATVDVPYLRVANVQSGFLDLTEVKTIPALPSEVTALRLMPGDVVLTEGGDFDKLGRGAVWTGQIENCIHQNHVFRVRFNQSMVLPEYFHEYLQSAPARNYFLRCAKKTTNLASINMTQLRELPVVVPSVDCQRDFVGRCRKVGRLEGAMDASLSSSDSLFTSLQHQAFSGAL